MKTQTKKPTKAKKPLTVKLLNASGKVIEGIILSGEMPTEDPTLKMARELGGKYKLEPTAIPK